MVNYIYINQNQSLKNILNAPYRYNNRLLDMVAERHLISVNMLTYIYMKAVLKVKKYGIY